MTGTEQADWLRNLRVLTQAEVDERTREHDRDTPAPADLYAAHAHHGTAGASAH